MAGEDGNTDIIVEPVDATVEADIADLIGDDFDAPVVDAVEPVIPDSDNNAPEPDAVVAPVEGGDAEPEVVEPVVPVEPVEGAVVEPATPVEPVVELTDIEAANAKIETLVKLVEKLSGGATTEESAADATAEPVAEPVAEATTIVTPDLTALMESVDFDKIMETKEDFVKFIFDMSMTIKEQTKQEMLTSIPNVVGSFVNRQTAMRDVAKEFYSKYPELKRVKKYVSSVANEISAAEPDLKLNEVLDKAALSVKETLGIKDAVLDADKVDATKPKPKATLPGGTQGGKKTAAPSTGLQSEIDDIIND